MWDIMPVSASSYATDIDNIIKLITYIVGGWLIVSYLVLFYLMFAFRRKEGRRPLYLPGTGKQMGWVLVPVVLVVMFDFSIDIYNTSVWDKIKINLPETEQTVGMIGKQWAWEFVYPGADGLLNTNDDVSTDSVLHVKLNAKTKFELQAMDVLHSMSIPAFRVKQDAVPGRTIVGWFEPTKTGAFDIQCAEICGLGHSFMAARVIVHPPEDFDKLMSSLINQKQTAALTAQMSAKPIQ